MLTAMIIGGVVAGTVSAVSKAKNRKVQAQEQELQLQRAQRELNDSKNNLTQSYELAIKQNEAETAEANAMIELQAGQTEAARDLNLKTAGQSAELQDRVAASQIAQLQVEVSEAQGQAVQGLATSGMRNIGSAVNAVNQATSKGLKAVNQAILQRNAARYSDYSSARDRFLSANNQLDLYKRQIENNSAALERFKEKSETTYKQGMAELERSQEYLNEDINFMNSDAYKSAQRWGYASDIFGGISTGLSFANSMYSFGSAF